MCRTYDTTKELNHRSVVQIDESESTLNESS